MRARGLLGSMATTTAEQRTEQVSVYFTPDQMRRLEAHRAKMATPIDGVPPLSAVCRMLVLSALGLR